MWINITIHLLNINPNRFTGTIPFNFRKIRRKNITIINMAIKANLTDLSRGPSLFIGYSFFNETKKKSKKAENNKDIKTREEGEPICIPPFVTTNCWMRTHKDLNNDIDNIIVIPSDV
jgi:hypothetical protein